MKYTFEHGEVISTHAWDGTNRSLEDTLEEVIRGEGTHDEMFTYCMCAARDAWPLPKNPAMLFWGYAEPQTMPSDARCEYFYKPTYLIVATMVCCANRWPGLMETDIIRDTISGGLYGCTGRGLLGSGYYEKEPLFENIKLFERAGIKAFLHDNPGICEPFREMIERIIEDIRSDYSKGKHSYMCWAGFEDFSERQREVLEGWYIEARDVITDPS